MELLEHLTVFPRKYKITFQDFEGVPWLCGRSVLSQVKTKYVKVKVEFRSHMGFITHEKYNVSYI